MSVRCGRFFPSTGRRCRRSGARWVDTHSAAGSPVQGPLCQACQQALRGGHVVVMAGPRERAGEVRS